MTTSRIFHTATLLSGNTGTVLITGGISNSGSILAAAELFNSTPADFNFTAISPLTISAGGSGSTNVTVNPLNGFSSAVSLSVSGQAAGVTASLSPSPVTPSGGSVLGAG